WGRSKPAAGFAADAGEKYGIAQGPLPEQRVFQALNLAGSDSSFQQTAIAGLAFKGGIAQMPIVLVFGRPAVRQAGLPRVQRSRAPGPLNSVVYVMVLHGQTLQPDQGWQHPRAWLQQRAAVAFCKYP